MALANTFLNTVSCGLRLYMVALHYKKNEYFLEKEFLMNWMNTINVLKTLKCTRWDFLSTGGYYCLSDKINNLTDGGRFNITTSVIYIFMMHLCCSFVGTILTIIMFTRYRGDTMFYVYNRRKSCIPQLRSIADDLLQCTIKDSFYFFDRIWFDWNYHGASIGIPQPNLQLKINFLQIFHN